MLSDLRPLWLVCEDGTEYHERFSRFLDSEFRFAHVADAEALLAGLAQGGAAGVLLDLDFRRTPRERLLDERGQVGAPLGDAEWRRLAANQGILILRHLRQRAQAGGGPRAQAGGQPAPSGGQPSDGVPAVPAVPVILCADLTDPGQAVYLSQTLGPLEIAPGHEGLRETAARMRRLSGVG